MTVKPITTEGKLLAQISGQLDELIGILRPEPAPPEPEPADVPADAKPSDKKAAPVKKAASRRKVTGQ